MNRPNNAYQRLNASLVLASLVAASLIPKVVASYQQEQHVERRYVKSTNVTLVSSDILYLINTPTQFLQLQFTGRYANEGLPRQMPHKITLQFQSFATSQMYQKDELRRFTAQSEDEVLDLGLLSYNVFREQGKDKYFADQKSRLGLLQPLPAAAMLNASNRDKPLTLESMAVNDVPLSTITKVARGNHVSVKIGDSTFPLSPVQLTILREFVNAMTPVGATNTPVESTARPDNIGVPKEVPSKANNASLDQTLKWLKKELPRNFARVNLGVRGNLEIVDLNNCRMKYRIIPLFRTSAVSSSLVYAIIEYQFNLADINPQTVLASDLRDFWMLTFSAVDEQPKIKVFSRANDNGMAGRTLSETAKSSGSLYLRDASSATQIRESFVHAIELCRKHP